MHAWILSLWFRTDEVFRTRAMAASQNNVNLFALALSRGPETQVVQQNDVQIAFWPPETTVRFLVTAALNACTAVAIISPKAGILAHIAPLPNGTTTIAPGTNPGPEHVRGLLRRLASLYLNNRSKFDPSETWVIAGIWNNQPAMADGIRLINAALTQLGLTATWRNYSVIPQGQPRREGETSVVIHTYQPGVMPRIYVNNTLLTRST